MSRFRFPRRPSPRKCAEAAAVLLSPIWRAGDAAPPAGRYTFSFPGHVARLNQLLGDWRRAARLKARDRRIIGLAVLAAGIPRAAAKRRVSLTITLGPRQRGADPDAYFKSTLDSLVHCGMLKDDSRHWCELGPVSYSRGPVAQTTITLEDI